MSKKIVGVTVGTTINPKTLEKKLKPVKTVNGVEPDENGNVQVGGSAEAVQENLDAHNQSKKNPHAWKPTAEEVCARPNTWLPSIADIGAAPSGYGLGEFSRGIGSATDLNDVTKNGWYYWQEDLPANAPASWCNMLVMSQSGHYFQLVYIFGTDSVKYRYGINGTWYQWNDMTPRNFAPAGYGLGEEGQHMPITDVAQIDNIKANGWYAITQTIGSPLILNGVPFNVLSLEVSMMLSDYGKQIVTFTDGLSIRRTMDAGAWQPWEWENPPMVPGVEYRTTKRHNGEVVYTMAVNCGNLPDNTTKYIEGVLPGSFKDLVDSHYVLTDGGYQRRTYHPQLDHKIDGDSSGYRWITLTTTGTLSGWTATMYLEYTKNT